MAKKRLDVAMTEQGLAESRQKAQAIIMAGLVYVNDQKVDKAGAPVADDAVIEVRGNYIIFVCNDNVDAAVRAFLDAL